MRVLVTGARGFVGQHAVRQLAARGDTVVGIARDVGDAPDTPNVVWERGDLLDEAAVDAVIARHRPTHLLHLAWVTDPGTYWTSPDNAWWAERSAQFFEFFATHGGERAVGAGTCAEYDWSGSTFDETETARPSTVYGLAKDDAHAALAATAARTGLSHAWGRIFFLYGPGEDGRRFVPSIAHAVLRGLPAVCRKPSLVRDWLHVHDVAAAFVALLDSAIDGPCNISAGRAASLGDVARRIAEAAGRPDLLELGDAPPAPGEPQRIVGVPGRLMRVWRPSMTLDDGIASTVAYWRATLSA